MIVGLLWIFGSYGFCIVMLHVIHRLYYHKPGKANYVLITGNNQHQIEWYVRTLHFFTWLKGKDVAITILDEGSTDETLAIVERLAYGRNIQVRVLQNAEELDQFIAEHADEPVVMMRLSNQKDLEKLPMPL